VSRFKAPIARIWQNLLWAIKPELLFQVDVPSPLALSYRRYYFWAGGKIQYVFGHGEWTSPIALTGRWIVEDGRICVRFLDGIYSEKAAAFNELPGNEYVQKAYEEWLKADIASRIIS